MVLLMFIHIFSFGQKLSKEEEKALKNEIGNLIKNPELYQNMKKGDEENSLRMREIAKDIFRKQKELNELKQKLNASTEVEKSKMAALETKKSKKLSTSNVIKEESEKEDAPPPPVIFRVQIGAYQNKYLSNVLKNQQNFFIENKDNQMKRYVLGKFTRYEEAQSFAQYLNQRGAVAFVVVYFTEKRLENIKELPENYRPKEK